MNLAGTILVYAGLLAFLVGGTSILRPLRFLGIWSRGQGVMLLVGSLVLFLLGASLPAPEQRVDSQATRLDEFLPVYQFEELHSIRIKAPRERVAAAIREVTPREIALFSMLTWIRRAGQSGREGILNAPPDEPLLDLALRTSFMKLAEDPNREIVLGTLVAAPKGTRLKKDPTPEDFKALQSPHQPAVDSKQPEAKQEPNAEITEAGAQSSQRSGFALAAINFRMEDAANGETVLATETRVYATDAPMRKKCAAYWRLIYPGSAVIRVTWLRAIRARAERAAP
jgi:hypothetical protein